MITATVDRSGKPDRDEIFPVAYKLIRRWLRDPIRADYRFARTLNDEADHAALGNSEKPATLDRLKAALFGDAHLSQQRSRCD